MIKPAVKFPRLGPVQARILRLLAKSKDGMSTDEVGGLGLFEDPRQHVSALASMGKSGLLTWRKVKKVWCATPHGRAMVKMMATSDPEPKYKGVITPPRCVTFTGTYTGAELRPQQARPGGNTHTTIPSLFSGQRVMRRAA
jgi:hypothetical protein